MLIAQVPASCLVLSLKSESFRQILDVTWIKQYRLRLCNPASSGQTLLVCADHFQNVQVQKLKIMHLEKTDIIGCIEKVFPWQISPFLLLLFKSWKTNRHLLPAPLPLDISGIQFFHPQHLCPPPCPHIQWRSTQDWEGLAACAVGSESCLTLRHRVEKSC